MEKIVIGVDPHKLSATIEVVDHHEKVLGSGRFATDKPCETAQRLSQGRAAGQGKPVRPGNRTHPVENAFRRLGHSKPGSMRSRYSAQVRRSAAKPQVGTKLPTRAGGRLHSRQNPRHNRHVVPRATVDPRVSMPWQRDGRRRGCPLRQPRVLGHRGRLFGQGVEDAVWASLHSDLAGATDGSGPLHRGGDRRRG